MGRKHIEVIPFYTDEYVLYTDEYVHLFYVSSSPSYSHLDKCADQFLHPALVHRFEKSRLKSWLVELQLPHLVDIVTLTMLMLILVKIIVTMLMIIVLCCDDDHGHCGIGGR